MNQNEEINLLKVWEPSDPMTGPLDTKMYLKGTKWGIKFNIVNEKKNIEVWIHSDEVKRLINGILDLKI